jgi:hypothetical protein
MTWRALLRRILPRKPPSVRLAKPRRMLTMQIGQDAGTNTLARHNNGAKAALNTPSEPLIEAAFQRQAVTFGQLQELLARSTQLANRLLGPQPPDESEGRGGPQTDPGSSVARVLEVQMAIDQMLKRIEVQMCRLERL